MPNTTSDIQLGLWEHPTTSEIRLYVTVPGVEGKFYWLCGEAGELKPGPGSSRVLKEYAAQFDGTWNLAVDAVHRQVEQRRLSRADYVEIHGRTYQVKDKLKAIGGFWNNAKKCFMVPPAVAEEARAIVDSVPPPPRQARAARRASITNRARCKGCGGSVQDCPHHKAMNGYCGVCAFDEFDH